MGFVGVKDIAEKIRSKPKREVIITNPKIFSLDYVPERIYLRRELDEVIKSVRNYLSLGVPEHIIVYGSKGSGKTVSLKFLLRAIREGYKNVLTVYINCRNTNTEYKVYKAILGRAVSALNARDKVIRKLKSKKAIIVLDDIEALIKPADLLFILSRETNAQMIISATNIYWYKNLQDEAVKSSLLPQQIVFKQYNPEEISKILLMRAQEGLARYDEGIINLIAALVARDYQSDVRIAIRALYHIAKNNDWNGDAVREYVELASREVDLYTINTLSDTNLIVLYSALREKTTSRAYKIAKAIIRRIYPHSTLSKRTYFKAINYLQALGLLLKIQVKAKGRYTYEIELLVDRDIVERAFKERFREFLGSSGDEDTKERSSIYDWRIHGNTLEIEIACPRTEIESIISRNITREDIRFIALTREGDILAKIPKNRYNKEWLEEQLEKFKK